MLGLAFTNFAERFFDRNDNDLLGFLDVLRVFDKWGSHIAAILHNEEADGYC